jgi:uncharacterized protein
MTITDRIQADTAAATKSQDRPRVATLRLLVDALQKEAKQARGELDEQQEIAVLKRERKRRAEAAESEDAEAAIIDTYLPEQISEDELQKLVEDALAETGAESPRDIGKVMPVVMGKAAGRADGRRVSELVKERLGS